MIKRKVKFVQTSFETEELGARSALMQDAGKPSDSKGNPKLAPAAGKNDGTVKISKSKKDEHNFTSAHDDIFKIANESIFRGEVVPFFGIFKGIEVQDRGNGIAVRIDGNEQYIDQSGIDNLLRTSIAHINRKLYHVYAGLSEGKYFDENDKEKRYTKKELEQLQKDKESLEAQKIEYTKVLEHTDSDRFNAVKELINSEIGGYFKEEVAKIESTTRKSVASIEGNKRIELEKVQQDPFQINQTEMDVFNIIKKYDFLKDPEVFKTLINTTTDEAVKTDALTLEKDLKKLGAHLKVDGKIDDNTIDAVEALISKNAAAIKTYRELTGIDPIKKDPGIGK